jgi:adenylate cyclase
MSSEAKGAVTNPNKGIPPQRETREMLELRLQRAEMLMKLSHRVAAIDKLDELLTTLVEIVAKETHSERGTLFLNDRATGELYSRIAQGTSNREIRILNTTGVAGSVFHSGEGEIVNDAYADERFNREVDIKTGYTTRSIMCVPVETARGEVIGVVQTLNKKDGEFTADDMSLLSAMALQASSALQSTQFMEHMEKTRQAEMEFLDLVADITSSLDLSVLLRRVMSEATRMLNADRSTLFLNNDKTNELWSEIGEGLNTEQIHLPNHVGIAGAVFQSGKTINIPHAYADLRFNPVFDKKTGYFTRSILCVPVTNKKGKIIGVTQALNKRGGPFNAEDEARLKAFTAQVSIALENAKLFEDVQNMRNYNQSVLESMSSGVITLNEDGIVNTCNAAGYRILQITEEDILDKPIAEFFTQSNAWIAERLAQVNESGESAILMDASIEVNGDKLSVNVTLLPLVNLNVKRQGSMLMIEDISSEKRMKSTMARYMDPGLADRLLADGSELLGGQSVEATMLFSDIRSFTTLTEELGAHGTVSLLNEYFTVMVNCINNEGGMLDKFIGDALMAVFGIPVPQEDDADRAMRASIAMITELNTFNKLRRKRGQKPVDIGIGLNTDTIVSGNIGSPKRMDYTVIGDGVNLASRLESACKEYSAQILASEFTVRSLKGTYRSREVARVVVKGKTEPVGVYEMLDYHTEESFPNMSLVLNHFRDGLACYRNAEFESAIDQFRESLNLHPEDQLSQSYLNRCEHLVAHPPDESWDGVWVMDSK